MRQWLLQEKNWPSSESEIPTSEIFGHAPVQCQDHEVWMARHLFEKFCWLSSRNLCNFSFVLDIVILKCSDSNFSLMRFLSHQTFITRAPYNPPSFYPCETNSIAFLWIASGSPALDILLFKWLARFLFSSPFLVTLHLLILFLMQAFYSCYHRP